MKINNVLFISITLCFCMSTNIKSQNIDYGVIGGVNLNFLTLSSDYQIHEDINTKPMIGFNLGGYFEIEKGQIGLLSSLEYQRTQNGEEPGLVTRDVNGTPIGIYKQSIINNRLQINAIGTFQLKNRIYFGVGLSSGLLLKSTLKLGDNLTIGGNDEGKRFTNYHYNVIVISIPIIVGYNFDRVGLFLKFTKGLSDNIGGNDNLIKEVDNTLMFGFRYSLNN